MGWWSLIIPTTLYIEQSVVQVTARQAKGTFDRNLSGRFGSDYYRMAGPAGRRKIGPLPTVNAIG